MQQKHAIKNERGYTFGTTLKYQSENGIKHISIHLKCECARINMCQ